MKAQARHRRIKLTPAMVAVIVAVVGQAAILINDFGATSGRHGRGDMITAAAVARAGAIEIPTTPAAGGRVA